MLVFEKYGIILTKEQSVLTKTESLFEVEKMQTQNTMLPYRMNIHFHDYKLAMEINENSHSNRNIDYEIKKTKSSRTKTCW